MIPFKRPLNLEGLVPWGSPEDVGCKTLAGSPQLFGRIDLGSFEAPAMAGLYKATCGTFKIPYPFHEHVCIIEGEVALTDASGEEHVFGPGDSWVVRKGETVVWEVRSDYVIKTFFTTTVDVA